MPCTKRFVIGHFSINIKLRSADFVNLKKYEMLDTCDLFQIKNYTYTHKFWIPHIFSILVSFLFNFSLKKLRFVSFRFSVFFLSVCFQVSETNILRCIWLDRKNLTTCILLFKVVLTQFSTSFSGPRGIALAWISLFLLVIHTSTSIFTTVGYLAALTGSSNRQYVVKKTIQNTNMNVLWNYSKEVLSFFLGLNDSSSM